MKITEAFLGEHAVLYAQFDHLEQALSTTITLCQVQSQVALLRSALESHARLEDKLLFNALEPHLDEINPLAIMRREHEGIAYALAALPLIRDVGKACVGLLFVIEVARQHFAKEEQVLYPLAKQVLEIEQLNQLGDQWAQRRGISVH